MPIQSVSLDWKPILVSNPNAKNLILDRTKQVTEYEVLMPEIYDGNDNFEKVQLSSETIDEKFITYDQDSNSIKLSIPC